MTPKSISQPVAGSTGPATAPSTAPAQESMTAKLITATDQVHVQSSKITFDAWELTYSPSKSLLTARGKEGAPGNIYNSDNGSTGIFDSLEWNTDTDQFKITNARGRVRR